VAGSRRNDHEIHLTEGASGESGAVPPRTAALLAAGFAIGAVAVGLMSLTLSPADPPAVRPIKLKAPDRQDRSGERDGSRERRRNQEQRLPERIVPPAPADRQDAAPTPPPASAPRPEPPAARPSPPTRSRPQPRPEPRLQPVPTPPPPAEDDGSENDRGDLGGED
jgi:hypothetical protein